MFQQCGKTNLLEKLMEQAFTLMFVLECQMSIKNDKCVISTYYVEISLHRIHVGNLHLQNL
jgi:hypothetical protein